MTVGSTGMRTRVTAALAVAALGVAGCSAQSGAAAVVEGEAIGVDAVHRATEELAPYFPEAEPASVLLLLVAEPTFRRIAREHGVGVSDHEARQVLEQLAADAGGEEDGGEQAPTGPPPEFGPEALSIARFTLLQRRLQELPDGAAVLERATAELEDLDIEVNPRFGEVDLTAGGITPVQHDWLVPPADPAP